MAAMAKMSPRIEVHVTPQVDDYLAKLSVRCPADRAQLDALMDYLDAHGHGSVLPDVGWKIQQSRYRVITGELRVEDPERSYRILFAMDPDERWVHYLVAGNKSVGSHQGNAWYDAWVPVADAYLEVFLNRIGFTPIN